MDDDNKANKPSPRAGSDATGGGHQQSDDQLASAWRESALSNANAHGGRTTSSNNVTNKGGGVGVSTYNNPPKRGSESGSNNGSDSGSDSGSNSGSDSGGNGGSGKRQRGRQITWATAGSTADNDVVNGRGRQRGQQRWPRKMWEGKGHTALLSHPLPFVIVVSPRQLGLTLTINSKGLAQRKLMWVAPGRKKRL
jgi:hypothetical protein